MSSIPETLVIDTMMRVVIAANVFALVIGIVMLLAPQWLTGLSRLGNRWVTLRKLTKPLDIMRNLDEVPLRQPRVYGVVIFIASGYILLQNAWLLISTNASSGGRVLADIFVGVAMPPALWESLWLTLLMLTLLGAIAGVLMALLFLFNTKMLVMVSATANRWISTRRGMRPLDTFYSSVDNHVLKKPRVWGGVITFLAMYAIVVLVFTVSSA